MCDISITSGKAQTTKLVMKHNMLSVVPMSSFTYSLLIISLFIGDHNKETYRLSTFHHFPIHAPVDPRLLAAHGFYYIGYRDRVKCFR